MKVHKALGPGFIEKVYENALVIQMKADGIQFEQQKQVRLAYAGQIVGAHVLDLLVENKVIVELKAKDDIAKSDEAAVYSYLRATGMRLALIINFGKPRIDIKRL